jgi:hypothetical protein
MAIRSMEGITDGSGGSEPSVLDVRRGENPRQGSQSMSFYVLKTMSIAVPVAGRLSDYLLYR